MLIANTRSQYLNQHFHIKAAVCPVFKMSRGWEGREEKRRGALPYFLEQTSQQNQALRWQHQFFQDVYRVLLKQIPDSNNKIQDYGQYRAGHCCKVVFSLEIFGDRLNSRTLGDFNSGRLNFIRNYPRSKHMNQLFLQVSVHTVALCVVNPSNVVCNTYALSLEMVQEECDVCSALKNAQTMSVFSLSFLFLILF